MNQPLTAAVRFLSGEREPVRVATTGNITLQGLLVIDDVELEVGDRVLVKNQSDQRQNGIWLASEGKWPRAPDASYTRAINEGVTVQVREGTANHGRAFRFSTQNPVIGTDPILITFYLSATFSDDIQQVVEDAKQEIRDTAEEIVQPLVEEAGSIRDTVLELVDGGFPGDFRFAVGGAVQSVDLGNAAIPAEAVKVFIDGVYQFSDTYDVTDGVVTPVGDTWPGDGVTTNMEVVIWQNAEVSVAQAIPVNGSVSFEKLDEDLQSRIDAGGTAVGLTGLTRSQLLTEDVPSEVEALQTSGFASAGDGGGALYKRAAAEPDHPGKFQSGDGAWWELAEHELTPMMFGAAGSSSSSPTVDEAAIFTSIFAYTEAIGGSLIKLHRYHLLGSILTVPGNLRMEGTNRAECGFKLADGVENTIFTINTVNNVILKSFAIDGNRAANSVGHAIRVAEANYVTLEDLYLHDVAGYAIGAQEGTLRGLKIKGNLIEDTGSDGIDMKNTDDDSEDIVISENTVRRPGRNGSLTVQACIDTRGPCRVLNNFCEQFGDLSSTTGIRARNGEAGDPAGLGAHDSIIHGNQITGNGSASSCGIDAVGYRIRVSDNNVQTCNDGIRAYQVESIISGNTVIGGSVGISSVLGTGSGLPTDGDCGVITGNIVRGAASYGYRIYSDNCVLTGNIARTCGTSFRTQSTANSTLFVGNKSFGHTVASFSDTGTNTVNVGNSFP